MKKVIIIIVAVVVGLAVLGGVAFGVIASKTKKMVCKSNEGDITLVYNNKTIVGYTALGMGYDFDEQKAIAEKIGIEAYLDEFDAWFTTNTTGKCSR